MGDTYQDTEDIYYDAISAGTLAQENTTKPPDTTEMGGAKSSPHIEQKSSPQEVEKEVTLTPAPDTGQAINIGQVGELSTSDPTQVSTTTDLSGETVSHNIDDIVLRDGKGRAAQDKQRNSKEGVYSFAKPVDWNTVSPNETSPSDMNDAIYSDVALPGRTNTLGNYDARRYDLQMEDPSPYEFARNVEEPPASGASNVTSLTNETGDFEIVHHPEKRSSPSKDSKHSKYTTALSHSPKKKSSRPDLITAKRKSKTLKRGKPFPSHSALNDPKDGALHNLSDMEEAELWDPMHHFDSSGSGSWSSSEFDSCSSDLTDNEDSPPTKPLPLTPKQMRKRANAGQNTDVMVLPVELKTRRPDPALPECPTDLSTNQIKIRGVLASLTDSEASYIRSLDRLDKEYREPILTLFGLRKPEVKKTFDKIAEILNIHKICQIELGEKLKHWNTKEEIGNIFNIFSGQMVIDAYSEYVNSFEAATELFKEAERTKPAFKEFLKNKQMASTDRLNLPGLMLKPVQRFPQFIMIIKDLLKYTAREHHDRELLQEALTGIENVAHQLNERKRQSEQRYHGNQILKRLRLLESGDKNCFLIRQDDVDQLSDIAEQRGPSHIFLLNDRVICCRSVKRETDGVLTDRYTLKWTQNLRDLELRDSAITPNMHTKLETKIGSTSITSPKLDLVDADPFNVMSDLNDLMHDFSVLGQISALVSTLKLSYKGLSDESIEELMVSAQKEIQSKDYQLQMLSSCSIILIDNNRKKRYIFQTSSSEIKQEWCVDFLLAKFALDASNCPSWYRQDSEETMLEMPAYFMKHLSVDMARSFARVKCAIPVYFPTVSDGVGVQHLWVCSSTEDRGQVSLVSLHTSRPNLIESFRASDCEIICTELVPGFALVRDKCAFEEDTVWISTVDSEILVFSLGEQLKKSTHRQSVHVFKTQGIVFSLLYLEDKVFGGLRSGSVMVYLRDDDGIWHHSRNIMLGTGVVTSMVSVQDSLWVGCGSFIYIIDIDALEIDDKIYHASASQEGEPEHIAYLVKAGVGVWVSCKGKPYITLYHMEQRRLLQDFNIGLVINEFLADHTGKKETRKDYEVTSLVASLGMLWVGTNIGLTLTYPLPRLRAGVPRIKKRPQVAIHGHNGPIKFIIPVQYGPDGGTAIRRQSSSVVRKESMQKAVIHSEGRPEGQGQGHSNSQGGGPVQGTAQPENLYEEVNFQIGNKKVRPANPGYEKYELSSDQQKAGAGYSKLNFTDSQSKTVSKETKGKGDNDKGQGKGQTVQGQGHDLSGKCQGQEEGQDLNSRNSGGSVDKQEEDLTSSVESHKYFILEPLKGDSTSNETKQSTGQTHGGQGDSQTAGTCNQADDRALTQKDTEGRESPCVAEQQEVKKVEGHVEKKEKQGGKMPVSFRTELKQKLQVRTSQDLADRPVTETEVAKLYDTLMRAESKRNSTKPVTKSGSEFRRNRMETNIEPKKPLYSSGYNPSKNHYTMVNMPHDRPHRVADMMQPQQSGRTKIGSSFSAGSTVDTLRKQDTNTLLVVSGGDGYTDWKRRHSSPYRQDEACLIFWLYKF